MITTMEFEAMKGSVLLFFPSMSVSVGWSSCGWVYLYLSFIQFLFVILALFCYCVSNCDLFE